MEIYNIWYVFDNYRKVADQQWHNKYEVINAC